AQGRAVDLKNTVLTMTSILGTADLRKASIGFTKAGDDVTYEKMKERVGEALKQNFRPEFLNRIDETIVFHELSREEVTSIVDLMMRRVREQLEAQGLGLELTDAAKDLLAAKGYDPSLGARPLRRAIQRMVEDPLSERILWKAVGAGLPIIGAAGPRRGGPGGRRQGAEAPRGCGRRHRHDGGRRRSRQRAGGVRRRRWLRPARRRQQGNDRRQPLPSRLGAQQGEPPRGQVDAH